jgi:hypothetical protein
LLDARSGIDVLILSRYEFWHRLTQADATAGAQILLDAVLAFDARAAI